MIRTLIVDDSSLVRSIIKRFFQSEGSFEIVGEAENGQVGVEMAQELDPDLITTDIEMPVMNGLEAIKEINKLSIPVVVYTSHSSAKMAYDCMVAGAMEFYDKGLFTSRAPEAAAQREKMLQTLKHIAKRKKRAPTAQAAAPKPVTVSSQIECVAIAASTGGPKALCALAAELPEDFPVPIVLVQHNSSGFDVGFAQWLNSYTKLNVCLAADNVMPVKGNLYVAPTDKHLLVTKRGFRFDDGEAIHNQKPAADLTFKSASETYGQSLLSVVLTGMGSDGADGTRYVKQAGGITIAQDEASSMIYGMPMAAAETGCVDIVLPLNAIARKLLSLTARKAGA